MFFLPSSSYTPASFSPASSTTRDCPPASPTLAIRIEPLPYRLLSPSIVIKPVAFVASMLFAPRYRNCNTIVP